MRIACVTTCRGRLHHLSQTLPQNINDRGAWPDTVFIVLDYNDTPDLGDYIKKHHAADLASGRLVYYRNDDAPKFHMANAKNQAHRCAIREGADILVTLDSDNYTGPGFIDYIAAQYHINPALSYLAPDFDTLPEKGRRYNPQNPLRLGRGFAGRLVIRSQDFMKIGGYNEVFAVWGGEDVDILARLKRMQFTIGYINPVFLNAIGHSSALRFKEYPEAIENENDKIYSIVAKAQDTVVNYGNWGCGTVYRNFDPTPIKIDPLPTRVFGIGMQRTGTTSLDVAFQSFGWDSGHWKSADWAKSIWQSMHRWGNSRLLEQDYALTDNPIPSLYKKLDEAYPGSKFILTVRNEDEWIESVRKFWTNEGNPERWVWDIDGFSHKMHGIVYGRADFDEQTFREVYRKHNADVCEYFKDNPNFLRIDVNKGTTMDALCKFLDQPMKFKMFPHKNKAEE